MTAPALAVRDPTDPRTCSLAVHEAAHAVVLANYGMPAPAWLRHPATGHGAVSYSVAAARARPLQFAVAALAGSIASAALDGADPIVYLRTRGTVDLDEIDRVAGGLTDTALGALLRRAQLLVLDSHADAVAAVAAALITAPGQHLTARQVADLADDHGPNGISWLLKRSTEHLNVTTHSTGRNPR